MSKSEISEEQFLGALTQASGIFSITVELIKELYKVDVSRQAVRQRALLHPKTLQRIREESVIDAEDTERDLMLNSKSDSVRKGCAEFILDRIGKDVGYTPRQELGGGINVDYTGKVATYHLPDNGRDNKVPKKDDDES